MKKMFLGIIPVVMLVVGCAGNPSPISENPTANSGLITLDQALNEAASRIDERIPAGSKIAPLNFNSPHDKFSDYVLEELTANLVESRKLTVVDRREIDLIRNEIDFQFSGEVGDDSMQQIGRMLGAQSIISGNFTDMGGFIRIMIRVLNVQNASVEVQYRANIVSDTVTTALLTGGRRNVATTTSRQTASPTGTQTTVSTASNRPTTPAAPMRFTVTFNANGASGTVPSSQTVQNGESIIIPDNGTLTSSRGNFGGWNTRSDGTGTPYAAGDALVVNTNIQLFARWIERVYRIGDTGPAGGIIFYDKGNNSGGWRYLEAAPADIAQRLFMTSERITINESQRAVGTGRTNTRELMIHANNLGGGFGWAAQACVTFELNGFSDWFLPSRDELNFMYGNLHMRNMGGFSPDWYWSSTFGGHPSRRASHPVWWGINFSNGVHADFVGNRDAGTIITDQTAQAPFRVRPIRQF